MAINKNFVIKNGIQVNDTLLVGDPLTNRVGINTAIPEHDLQIVGGIGVTDARITGVTTALGDVLVANSSGEDGKAFAVRVSAGNSVGINTANPRYPLEVIGPAQSGTIAEYVFGDLEITGDINSANFSSGNASFSGITTFTNTTQNIIGNPETGAVQIRGGLGVSRNLSVGAGLSVAGNSYFVGVVTFAAGASGKIQLGDNANDNVEFQADVNSNIIPNVAGFDLGSSSQKWRELHLAGNAGIGSLAVTGISTFSNNVRITSLTNNRIPIVGAGSTIEDDANLTFDGNTLAVGTALTVTGISTFNSDVDINADIDVSGNIGVGSLAVTGISTFVGLSTFNNGIAVLAGVSTFLGDINADSNLDVDGRTDLDDLVVTGVSTYSADLDINADVDVSGNIGVGSLSVSGISTFSSDIDINADVDITGNIGIGSLTVSGISTFVGLSTFNGGIAVLAGVSTFLGNINADGGFTANTAIVEDLTDNRIVIAGVGGELEDDANLTFNGATLSVGVDLDVDGHTELDNVNVSGASTFVGVSSFTNTTENTLGDANTGAIKVDGGIGIAGNVTVGGGLSVTGNSYFVGMVTFAAGTDGNITLGDTNTDNVIFNADVNSNITPNTDATYDLGSDTQQWKNFFAAGNAGIGSLSVSGVSTFTGTASFQHVTVAGVTTYTSDVDINANLDVDGRTDLDDLVVTGVSTYSADLDINADIDVLGNAGIGSLDVVGVSTFGGITTFTDTTENTIGTTDTGAVKIAGGLAVAKNVTVGGGLSVTGNSYFVGMVTFAAGTNGNITIGDANTDNVVFNADVNSNFIPNTDNAYDLGSSSQQWKNLYVNGLSDLDFVNVSAASTFADTINANGRIVGVATSNVIPFLYADFSDLPSPSTYHGAFAHVHATGKAYYAHANAWYELVNKNLAGIVGTGTEGYNVGVVTATQADIGNGGLDVDGHTELDNLNVSGVATFAQTGFSNINVSGITTTQTLHVGTGGTTLTVSADNATFAIGSATTTVTATMNGGAIPSIGLVIALGG